MYELIYVVVLWVSMFVLYEKIMKLPKFQIKYNALNKILGEKYYYIKISLLYVVFQWLVVDRYSGYHFYYYATAIATLFLISAIDFQTHIIPDKITYPLMILFAVWNILISHNLFSSLYGLVVGGVVSYVLIIISVGIFGGAALGGGDLKLNALIGTIIGFPLVAYAMLYGFIVAGLTIMCLVLIQFIKVGNKNFIPYGPFFFLGTVIALLYS